MKGIPQWGQNRQFQYFSKPTFIYPMVPASAATILNDNDFSVDWYDGVAQRESYGAFMNHFNKTHPDLLILETKTPIINRIHKFVKEIKNDNPEVKIALVGDHVTALPHMSIHAKGVDYVIPGGNWDYPLLQLSKHIRDGLAVPEGILFKNGSTVGSTGEVQYDVDLNEIPHINRDLTKWFLYYENWRKRKPFTYVMAGRDCWWRKDGGCTFCSWTNLYPHFNVKTPERHLDEISILREKYNIREIFDDTGTFPTGKWIEKFCKGMIDRGLNEDVLFSCNFRYDQLNEKRCKLMKKAGFRLVKMGLESGNQETLDRLNKGTTIQQIIDGSKTAKKAGLEIHLTIMVGFPWESKEDALRTLNLAKRLMENGWADVLQCTIITPYPGTRLHEQALTFNWFRIDPQDYDRYDMTEPVLHTVDMSPKEVLKICDDIYKIYLSPKYIFRRFIRSLTSKDDLMLNINGLRVVLGHIKDFASHEK